MSREKIDQWSETDRDEYARLLELSEVRELSEPEKAKFKEIFVRKFRHSLTDPVRKHMAEQIEKSIALVDDMVADGAKLTSSDKAEMAMLLYTAEDKMIQRYALIKKAGRSVVVNTAQGGQIC